MTPHEFIAKWKPVTLTERSACQQHFLDLCEVLDQPKPAKADPEGTFYTFERGVKKVSRTLAASGTLGTYGWADVWWRDHFGWEYKGKHHDLKAAYNQLLQYREDLENPPLLVVCDMDRFEVHTNFTGTVKRVYAFDLDGLADPDNLGVLRKMFIDPQSLKPGQTAEAVTAQAAEHFGRLADGMRQRGIPAEQAARFLMKLMFCMFAEDIALLPEKLFTRLLTGTKSEPAKLSQMLAGLFTAMCSGGAWGVDDILHFNGGLFADAEVVPLTTDEIKTLITVNRFDWSSVEPSIFGTLFERTLDPAKRSQIGAHYTSRDDILTLLEPVMMTPLRREWDAVREQCDEVTRTLAASGSLKPATRRRRLKQRDQLLRGFVERLADVTVLDPACGSGNFLYVALHLLLDLEKEVIAYAARQGIGLFPHVRPTQLAGIEINRYAQELAQVVIWIGYLQWMRDNGFAPPRDPVLEPIESIRRMDAILDLTNPAAPLEPEWPEAEFIVGNPPFLGSSLFRELGIEDQYTKSLSRLYELPGKSDLCCYWFERARHEIQKRKSTRVGLLATQSIRHGGSRSVLESITKAGGVFFAISDKPWILDGASVRVSLVGFDGGMESNYLLDGTPVTRINADLTAGIDFSAARSLNSNLGISFEGDQKGGDFDPTEPEALQLLGFPNPNGNPTSDVLFPRVNADMLVKTRSLLGWVIDFGTEMPEDTACRYEAAFEYLRDHVHQKRQSHSEQRLREKWWIHKRPRPEMKAAISRLGRFIVTPRVGKHRLFVWQESPVVPDSRLFVFAREDDFTFGILHSQIHEVWSLRKGARHGDGESGGRPTYNNAVCFETFPFPDPTDEQRNAIAAAAKELDRLRNNWLNPPEWTRTEVLEFPGTADGPWKRYIDADERERSVDFSPRERHASSADVSAIDAANDARVDLSPRYGASRIGTVRYPRVVPRDEDCAKQLKKRTLTNLYNERPTWLDLAHRKLDEAVFLAYGWDPAISDDELLAKLLNLNLERASES